jgi:hypothetical protein
METIKCDKCQEYTKRKGTIKGGTDDFTLLPWKLTPSYLTHQQAHDTHLCKSCAKEANEILTEWFGFNVEKLRLIDTPKSQLIIYYGSDDNDSCDDHTSLWGGAGPDCIVGRLETAH